MLFPHMTWLWMRSMSFSDLRLKRLRWFFMRSTALWKSSWSSANICFTWEMGDREGRRREGRKGREKEQGREMEGSEHHWAEATYLTPTPCLISDYVHTHSGCGSSVREHCSESWVKCPGNNCWFALISSKMALKADIRTALVLWYSKRTERRLRDEGETVRERGWRREGEGEKMKGRRWRGEDKGEREK